MDLLKDVISSFVFPSGLWMTALAVVQCLLVIVNGINEYSNPTPYSKFASSSTKAATESSPKKIPSRQGMVLLYAPSMIASMAFAVSNYNNLATTTMAVYLVGLHFAKRVFESLFLHRYSGCMEFNASMIIGTFYTLVSVLVILTSQPWNADNNTTQQVGLFMFIVGEVGNLYHHYLLRILRSPSNKNNASRIKKNDDNDDNDNKKRYVPPTGGLFDYVVAPHYMFEIVAFLGIACTSQSVHGLLVALGMASYLTGRACRTLQFYHETFDKLEFSRDKKALIPFVL